MKEEEAGPERSEAKYPVLVFLHGQYGYGDGDIPAAFSRLGAEEGFVTLAPQPKLSGKHVVFGALVQGAEVLALIEAAAHPDGADEKPTVPVVIAECGVVTPEAAK